MLVFLNGQFVPEERAVVSVFDRAYLYGDGLFETICVLNGQPFRWHQHLKRLAQGAAFLKIQLPYPVESLRGFAGELIARNQMADALLRLTLSRGVGPRGFSPKDAGPPSLAMSLHPAPPSTGQGHPGWRLIISTIRLPAGEALARFKTCNKLAQILARAEADAAGADEALLLNTDGHVVEASSSNLFWVKEQTVRTPPLASGVLAGVTRAIVFEICRNLGITVQKTSLTPDELGRSDSVFLSLSSMGIIEGCSLDGHVLAQSPLTGAIRDAYWDLVRTECQSVA